MRNRVTAVASILLLMTVIPLSAGSGQWTACKFPVSTEIYRIASNNKNTFIAGSQAKGLYLSKNHCSSWNSITNQSCTSLNIYDLAFKGDSIYEIVTGYGIFLSEDNGEKWKAMNSGLKNLYVCAITIDRDNIYAGTLDGVFLSTDNGLNWKPINNGLTFTEISSIIVKDGIVFAGTKGGGIFVTSDKGANWVPANDGLTSLGVSCLAVSGIIIYAGLHDGGVCQSVDNGEHWKAMNNGLTYRDVHCLATHKSSIFAGTNKGGGIFYSSNYGRSWRAVNRGIPISSYYRINDFEINGDTIYAVMYKGIYKTGIDDFLFKINVKADTLICEGDSIEIGVTSIDNGYEPYKYKWSPPTGLSSTSDPLVFASPVEDTKYKIIVSDYYGQCDSAVFPIWVFPKPEIPTVNDTTISEGESATLVVTAPENHSYYWYDSDTKDILLFKGRIFETPVLWETTHYYVESGNSDTKCRSELKKVTVSIKKKNLTVTSLGNMKVCAGNPVSIGVESIERGVPPYTYKWSPSESLSSASDSVVTAFPEKTTDYQLIVNDSKGRADTLIIRVTVLPLPAQPVINDDTVSIGGVADLAITGPDGASFYWYGSETGESTINRGLSYTTPMLYKTTYYYIETEDSITKCRSERKKVTVTVIPMVTTLGDRQLCYGDSVEIGVKSVNYGSRPFTYEWTPDTGISSAVDSVVTVSPTESIVYYLTVTDNGGRTQTDTIRVTVNPLPLPNAADTLVNKGDISVLTAIYPYDCTFRWYDTPTAGNLVATGNKLKIFTLVDTCFYLEAEDNSTGCISDPRKRVCIDIERLGVEDGSPAISLVPSIKTIRPNPAEGDFEVIIESAVETEIELAIYSLPGIRLHSIVTRVPAGTGAVLFAPGKSLPPGAYLLKLTSRYGSDSKMMIIK